MVKQLNIILDDKEHALTSKQLKGECVLCGNEGRHGAQERSKSPIVDLKKTFDVGAFDLEVLTYIRNFGSVFFDSLFCYDNPVVSSSARHHKRVSNRLPFQSLLLAN